MVPDKYIGFSGMTRMAYSVTGMRLTKGSFNRTFTPYLYDGIKLQSKVTQGTGVTKVTKVTTTSFSYTPSGEPYSIHLSTLTSLLSTSHYYHLNAHGDVISLTDKNAREVASYSYSPWGNVESSRGPLADSNPIRYAGYYFDSETGLYYLINRYYDPEIGRFISKDEAKQTNRNVLTRNPYLYCCNDSINFFDPNGTKKRHTQWHSMDIIVYWWDEGGPHVAKNKCSYQGWATFPNNTSSNQYGYEWIKYNTSIVYYGTVPTAYIRMYFDSRAAHFNGKKKRWVPESFINRGSCFENSTRKKSINTDLYMYQYFDKGQVIEQCRFRVYGYNNFNDQLAGCDYAHLYSDLTK